MVSSDTMR